MLKCDRKCVGGWKKVNLWPQILFALSITGDLIGQQALTCPITMVKLRDLDESRRWPVFAWFLYRKPCTHELELTAVFGDQRVAQRHP